MDCFFMKQGAILMAAKKQNHQELLIQDVSVIDLILFDHQLLKECVEILLNDEADKGAKLSVAKSFLDALHIHSLAERRAIYLPLETNEELHFLILEAEIEHGIIDQKVRLLRPKLANVRILPDELEAECKVLADLVKNHLVQEEGEIFLKMREEVDEETLIEMGQHFMRLRRFSPSELAGFPVLEEELVHWKDAVQRIQMKYLKRMDRSIENLKH